MTLPDVAALPGSKAVASRLSDDERLKVERDEVRELILSASMLARPRYVSFVPSIARAELSRIHAALVLGRVGDLAEMLVTASEPADAKEIRNHLAALVGAFPNAGRTEGEIYGRLLIGDVLAANPSRAALETACRQLRRTRTFLPAISEVLTEIAKEEATLSGDRARLGSSDTTLLAAEATVARREAEVAEDAAREARLKRRVAETSNRTAAP